MAIILELLEGVRSAGSEGIVQTQNSVIDIEEYFHQGA
jgi:hypothetical protein